jgi:ERF superfamily
MQRSSESIASLAAALAKAQIELVNPVKSLVGTIHPDGAAHEGLSFNYASLASGLDIVRKTLGQHEIATVQTTALDQSAGIVNLTTVLAHSSGEWIASDWPVCSIRETPHRMGAALTYARRYALFTLVGIAGEDDLDAPDLKPSPTSQNAPTSQTLTSERPRGAGNGHLDRGRLGSRGVGNTTISTTSIKILAPADSAILRDRLLDQLANLGTADEAALWAKRSLAEKNKLINDDAQRVEDLFQVKLSTFAAHPSDTVPVLAHATAGDKDRKAKGDRRQPTTAATAANTPVPGKRPQQIAKRADPRVGEKQQQLSADQQAKGIDKSALALPERRRVRDREHLRHVAAQACLLCGRIPCDAHHLRFTQNRALGRKVSDEFTVPLCRGHHREVHRCGDEAAWWGKLGIEPTITARALWLESHPLPFGQDQEDREHAPDSRLARAVRRRKDRKPIERLARVG